MPADDDPFPSAADVSTHGPVKRLAPHVPEDWWATLFGPTYLFTDADVLEAGSTRDEVDRFADLLELAPSDDILDLCCGQGRHALELARRGFERVQGLDRSAYLIEEAQRTAQAEDLPVPFEEGDCRALPYADASFDAVMILGNAFGYFEAAEDDRAVLDEVRRVLRPGGRLLLDLSSGAYLRQHFEPRSWEWIDEEQFVCRERELAEDGRRLVSREIIAHVDHGVQVDQFYAERLYDRDQIRALLREAGFAAVEVAGEQATASTRGQDLGMMARRMAVLARAPRSGSSEDAATTRRHVTVVLGDPRLPDAMKLGGRFDADDFEVVDRLKEALSTLPGFRFGYADEHAALLRTLRDLRGETDLVLNLCDEGLRNDPQQELHVPALLEAFGVPYTGAGPQALAHCYDKSLTRGAAREVGIAVADGVLLTPSADLPVPWPLDFPVIVKPNRGDSSIGIMQHSVAEDAEDAQRAVDAVRQQVGEDVPLLIERFLTGQDLTVSLIGNAGSGFTVLPITEDDYGHLPGGLPPLCGYEAKWLPDSPYYMQEENTKKANLTPAVREAVVDGSRRMFERLGCRDYARFDWRCAADGRPRLLEVNPNPGWCWDGHMAVQARHAGLSYAELLEKILEAAFARVEREA